MKAPGLKKQKGQFAGKKKNQSEYKKENVATEGTKHHVKEKAD